MGRMAAAKKSSGSKASSGKKATPAAKKGGTPAFGSAAWNAKYGVKKK